MEVRRIMSESSPLEFIASGAEDAKSNGKLNHGSEQLSGIVAGGVDDVLSEKIGRTAELEELPETVEIAGERALLAAIGDAGAHDFIGGVEKDDGSRMAGKELAIGGLEERAATQGQHRGTPQAGKNEVKMMMLNSAEAAFTTGGKELGNGAVGARDLDIEIDERAGKLERKEASDGALASAHESDEDQ
jgi:hypothetical protein